MDYLLTEEQIMVRDLARQIAEEKIVPVRAELDEHNKFPAEIMKAIAQSDLFGIYIPEEYGGFGKKSLELSWMRSSFALLRADLYRWYSCGAYKGPPILQRSSS